MKVGQRVNVTGWSIGTARIIAIHAAGTVDVQSETTGRCYRLSGLPLDEDETDDLPPCVLAMGCACALHAVGAPVTDECDANEDKARAYAAREGGGR